jgi:soluble lytic murein transglycosylase
LIDTRQVSAPAADRLKRRPVRLDRWMVITLIVMLVAIIGLILAKALMETYLYTQQAAREAAHQKLLNEHPLPEQYLPAIEEAAQKNNVKPAFLAAIILCESSYRKEAESSVGARGLMQIMPETAAWIADKIEFQPFMVELLDDPDTNIRFGSWYLASLKKEFDGNEVLMLAAYNGGRGNVKQWIRQNDWPLTFTDIDKLPFPETREYVGKVLKNRDKYRSLYGK